MVRRGGPTIVVDKHNDKHQEALDELEAVAARHRAHQAASVFEEGDEDEDEDDDEGHDGQRPRGTAAAAAGAASTRPSPKSRPTSITKSGPRDATSITAEAHIVVGLLPHEQAAGPPPYSSTGGPRRKQKKLRVVVCSRSTAVCASPSLKQARLTYTLPPGATFGHLKAVIAQRSRRLELRPPQQIISALLAGENSATADVEDAQPVSAVRVNTDKRTRTVYLKLREPPAADADPAAETAAGSALPPIGMRKLWGQNVSPRSTTLSGACFSPRAHEVSRKKGDPAEAPPLAEDDFSVASGAASTVAATVPTLDAVLDVSAALRARGAQAEVEAVDAAEFAFCAAETRALRSWAQREIATMPVTRPKGVPRRSPRSPRTARSPRKTVAVPRAGMAGSSRAMDRTLLDLDREMVAALG